MGRSGNKNKQADSTAIVRGQRPKTKELDELRLATQQRMFAARSQDAFLQELDYDFEALYVSQALDITGLPQQIDVDGTVFAVTPHPHLSLFTTKHHAQPLIEMLGGDQEQAYSRLQEAANLFSDIEGVKLLPKLLRVAREERESIVAMMEVPGLQELYERASKLTGLDISVIPPHLTLYTLPGVKGIGLTTDEHMRELTRPLSDIEADQLHAQGVKPGLAS